ncbi:MAG TPA: TIGR01459 family HAD-type hydrolase, partial [Caulobacteraceae bacterium]
SAWSGFVTSGDATRAELARRAPGPAWALGPERDAPLYAGLGLELVDSPLEAAFLSCTGLIDDETETPEDYRGQLARAAARDLEMICANPDRVVQRGDKMVFCSGALADVYESLGGRVTMAGKPYPPIYTLALDEASRLLDRPVDRRRVLCVGDGIPTDVKGANNQGLDLLFVAAGIHGEEARGDDGALDPARVTALLERESASATYAMLDLAW